MNSGLNRERRRERTLWAGHVLHKGTEEGTENLVAMMERPERGQLDCFCLKVTP